VEQIQSLQGLVWSAGVLNIFYIGGLFNLIALLSGLMGWDGALVVRFFMTPFALSFISLTDTFVRCSRRASIVLVLNFYTK
jgi:hypothetical protein